MTIDDPARPETPETTETPGATEKRETLETLETSEAPPSDPTPPPPHKPTTWSALRPLLLRLHFYAGVLVAPFLLVAALSGLLYALSFQAEKVVYAHELEVPVGDATLPSPGRWTSPARPTRTAPSPPSGPAPNPARRPGS